MHFRHDTHFALMATWAPESLIFPTRHHTRLLTIDDVDLGNRKNVSFDDRTVSSTLTRIAEATWLHF
jgi:hypothetical protein